VKAASEIINSQTLPRHDALDDSVKKKLQRN
jgi:hypothetical protein